MFLVLPQVLGPHSPKMSTPMCFCSHWTYLNLPLKSLQWDTNHTTGAGTLPGLEELLPPGRKSAPGRRGCWLNAASSSASVRGCVLASTRPCRATMSESSRSVIVRLITPRSCRPVNLG